MTSLTQKQRKVYGYVRASDAHKQEDSPERQREIIEPICQKAADEIGGVVADIVGELKSASEFGWEDRPVLQQLFKMLEPGDILVVWRMDRIERSPFRMIAAVQYLCQKQVGLIAVQERGGVTIDLRRVQDRSFVLVMALVADWWLENHSAAVKDGMARARKQGFSIGPVPPLGRRLVSMSGKPMPPLVYDPKTRRWGYPPDCRGQKWRVVWCDNECRQIAEIVQRVRAGEKFAAIARDFVERGVTRSCGIPWAHIQKRGTLIGWRTRLSKVGRHPSRWHRKTTMEGYAWNHNVSKAYHLGEKLISETGKIGRLPYPLCGEPVASITTTEEKELDVEELKALITKTVNSQL